METKKRAIRPYYLMVEGNEYDRWKETNTI
jgi:hypothetical protein